jgi:hypothetical protein
MEVTSLRRQVSGGPPWVKIETPHVPTLFSRWLYTTIGTAIYVDSRTKANPCARFELP